MFDLEQAIAAWRRQMNAAGLRDPDPLNELESHLREDVEQRMRSGVSEETAFGVALQQIGQAAVLREEFKKAGHVVGSAAGRPPRRYVMALTAFAIALLLGQIASLVPDRSLNSGLLTAFLQSAGHAGVGGLTEMYGLFGGGRFEAHHAFWQSISVLVFPVRVLAGFGFCYLLAILATLYARCRYPEAGRRLTRLLNLTLLPFLPWGTLIGIYGLKRVDRENNQYV